MGANQAKTLSHLLKMACIYGIANAVKVHLDRGEDVNGRDETGLTPLMLASSKGHGDLCSLLLQSGADPLLRDMNGCDAYELAVQGGHDGVAEIILLNIAHSQDTSSKRLVESVSIESFKESAVDGSGPNSNSFGMAAVGGVEDDGDVVPDFTPIKRRSSNQEKILAGSLVSPAKSEARRTCLKLLIQIGKDRGYITYGEINEHLPDDLIDAEVIDDIISTLSDYGIAVFDQTLSSDSGTHLLGEMTPVEANDDLEDDFVNDWRRIDSQFGCSIDWVYAYLGAHEMLTREGEIEVAKRIEDGLNHMVMAMSACPSTIKEILNHVQRVRDSHTPIVDIVDGLDDFAEYSEAGVADIAEDDDSARLEDLRTRSLAKFEIVGEQFAKLILAHEADGYRSVAYMTALEAIQKEFFGIRFTAKLIFRLAESIHKEISLLNQKRNELLETCVNLGGMPYRHFCNLFPGNETNLDWITFEVEGNHDYSSTLRPHIPAVQELQEALITQQSRILLPLKELIAANRRMAEGASKVGRAKRAMLEARRIPLIEIASEYASDDISRLDLLREGTVGLIQAVDNFEYRRGYRFAAYASWWIRQSITKYIASRSSG